jgi:hypothetical protein
VADISARIIKVTVITFIEIPDLIVPFLVSIDIDTAFLFTPFVSIRRIKVEESSLFSKKKHI